jgi:hypothetical protein
MIDPDRDGGQKAFLRPRRFLRMRRAPSRRAAGDAKIQSRKREAAPKFHAPAGSHPCCQQTSYSNFVVKLGLESL